MFLSFLGREEIRAPLKTPAWEAKSKVEWKENYRKEFSKIWVFLTRLCSVLEIFENAVPFATGNCRKFKPDVLVEWKAPIVFKISF